MGLSSDGFDESLWLDVSADNDVLLRAATNAWVDCVAHDFRATEETIPSDHLVRYKTARTLQLVAEHKMIEFFGRSDGFGF